VGQWYKLDAHGIAPVDSFLITFLNALPVGNEFFHSEATHRVIIKKSKLWIPAIVWNSELTGRP
jgi:hypothetical protein